jgi:hypothetical protein
VAGSAKVPAQKKYKLKIQEGMQDSGGSKLIDGDTFSLFSTKKIFL